MRLLVTIVILLSLSSVISALDRKTKTKVIKRLAEFYKLNLPSFEAFNAHLEDEELSNDLERNKVAAESYNVKDEQIAKLVTNLNTDGDCTAKNIADMRRTVMGLVSYKPNMFEETDAIPRLSALVSGYIGQVTRKCLTKLNDDWQASENNFGEIETLGIEDGVQLLSSDKVAEGLPLNDETRMIVAVDYFTILRDSISLHKLGEALTAAEKSKHDTTSDQLIKTYVYGDFDISGSFEVEEMTKEDLARERKTIAAMVGKALKRMRSIMEKKEKKNEEMYTLGEARKFADVKYYAPCETLVKQDVSTSILEPVGQLVELANLAKLRNLANLVPDMSDGVTISLFAWTSRYYYCKWRLLQDKKQFAKMLFKEYKNEIKSY